MTWNRADAAAAVAAILEPLDPSVSVFAAPPETYNPPAYVVGYPTNVVYDLPAFGIDQATLPVIAAAGLSQVDYVDELLEAAKKAINAAVALDGAVQSCRVAEQQNWRVLNVAGVEMLAAEITLEIRM
jgi:hypothetical protein